MSEQSITIQGVPPSVTRAQVVEALRVLGLDPCKVVEFAGDERTTALHVTVYSEERPDAPAHRWTHDGKDVATHRLTIPVLDEEIPA